jgi:hypothetical protein
MKTCALFLCLFAPGLVFGQSLSDAAQKEKERRKAAVASPAPVFTNESLQTTRGQLANDPNTLPAVHERLAEPNSQRGNEAAWRARFAAAQARLDRAKRAYERWAQVVVLPHSGPKDGGAAAVAKMKDEVDDAQKAVDDVQEQARQAGVPPGWVR